MDKIAIPTIVYACHKLDLTDELLWRLLEREVDKLVHSFNARSFGAVYIAFLSNHAHSTP